VLNYAISCHNLTFSLSFVHSKESSNSSSQLTTADCLRTQRNKLLDISFKKDVRVGLGTSIRYPPSVLSLSPTQNIFIPLRVDLNSRKFQRWSTNEDETRFYILKKCKNTTILVDVRKLTLCSTTFVKIQIDHQGSIIS